MEKVSVIVPVYNGEQRVNRCAESILNQDYPELELILVDDGSRDGSWERMQAIAERDERVRIIHKENGGVSSARNRGLAEARGRYIQFADVDDWLPMDATKLLVREMEANPVELVIGDFYRVVSMNVSRKGSIAKAGLLSRREYADQMMLGPADLYYGALWNKLYLRDIIERHAVRMDESISYSEDMIFNLEYLLHVNTVAVLKAPVYYYQFTKGSLVDQGMNLNSTVKMKRSVIGYYNRFFKSIFPAPDYQMRLPVIYSYLLAVSRDSFALPFTPGTKKLDGSDGLSDLSDRVEMPFPMRGMVLIAKQMSRYLETIAQKHDLKEAELRILYCMEKLKEPCDAESLCLLTGLEKRVVNAALSRLSSENYVRDELFAGLGERFSFQAPELLEDFRHLERDMDAVCFDGFSEKEIGQYRHLQERINANILRRLQGETAKL